MWEIEEELATEVMGQGMSVTQLSAIPAKLSLQMGLRARPLFYGICHSFSKFLLSLDKRISASQASLSILTPTPRKFMNYQPFKSALP